MSNREKRRERVEHRIDWLAKKIAQWQPGSGKNKEKDEQIRTTMREEKQALEWLLQREKALHDLEVAAAAAVQAQGEGTEGDS